MAKIEIKPEHIHQERTDRQLKEEAADIVKNTVPNYAYVGQFVRGMGNLPFGNFMSFREKQVFSMIQ